MPDAAILLAAGQSRRMRHRVEDKILTPVAGIPVFLYSLRAFLVSGVADYLVIVHRDEEQRTRLQALLAGENLRHVQVLWAEGGVERRDSVAHALDRLPPAVEYVFIHDCARPLLQIDLLARLRQVVRQDEAVVLARPVTDTIKRVRGGTVEGRHCELEDLERSRLWAMETPQVFRRDLIQRAYRAALQQGVPTTDDAAAVSLLGHPVTLLENPFPNPKLTTPEDLAYLSFLLRQEGPARN